MSEDQAYRAAAEDAARAFPLWPFNRRPFVTVAVWLLTWRRLRAHDTRTSP